MRNSIIKGCLIGNAILAAIDRTGTVTDKENKAFIPDDYNIPLGYAAYIFDKSFTKENIDNFLTYSPNATILYDVEDTSSLVNFDVVEIDTNGILRKVYSDLSGDNVLFITNKCNSNCIMCPDSEKMRCNDLGNRVPYLMRLIDLIPSDTRHITITGGEPTLIKWELLEILEKCKFKFEKTDFLMLSNGKSFAVKEYRDAFIKAVPFNFKLAVPLYSYIAKEHDNLVTSDKSFEYTINAIGHLQNHIDVEIRIVVMKSNYKKLDKIADYIIRQLPNIKNVSFMGLELLGNAALNRDKIWVDYKETAKYIEKAIIKLYEAGIDAKIYNYPLCGLPRNLWAIAAKSITDYKVRYKPECDLCDVKCLCGGFFFSTINYKCVIAQPIRKE